MEPKSDKLGRLRLAICITQAEKSMIDGSNKYLQLMMVYGLGIQCIPDAKGMGWTRNGNSVAFDKIGSNIRNASSLFKKFYVAYVSLNSNVRTF